MLQFSAGQSGAQLPHELRTRTADSAARRDIIHADNYTTFALLLNGKRKTKKKLIGFALLYVIVCTHYVCGVVYNVYVSGCCYAGAPVFRLSKDLRKKVPTSIFPM